MVTAAFSATPTNSSYLNFRPEALLILISRIKSNPLAWWYWFRCHQSANGFKDDMESLVVFLFHFIKPTDEIGMTRKQGSYFHKSAHDSNVDLDSFVYSLKYWIALLRLAL